MSRSFLYITEVLPHSILIALLHFLLLCDLVSSCSFFRDIDWPPVLRLLRIFFSLFFIYIFVRSKQTDSVRSAGTYSSSQEIRSRNVQNKSTTSFPPFFFRVLRKTSNKKKMSVTHTHCCWVSSIQLLWRPFFSVKERERERTRVCMNFIDLLGG